MEEIVSSIGQWAIVLAVLVVVFLALRELFAWYSKVNERIAIQQSIDKRLKRQNIILVDMYKLLSHNAKHDPNKKVEVVEEAEEEVD